MKRLNTQHHYGPVFEVCAEAKQEKQDNWREVHGWATGDARVEHQDWRDVYADLRANDKRDYIAAGYGPAYLFVAYLPDGETIAHIGRIFPSRDGAIMLSG